MVQSNVATDVCVRAGKGGATNFHSLGGGAGVLMVDRDISETLETPPGEDRPPYLEGVGLLCPYISSSSSFTTSSTTATLQYGTCKNIIGKDRN